MPAPLNPFRCTTHPAAPAAWECLHCTRSLCPDCAATGETRSEVRTPFTFTCCVHCDGPVRPLLVQGTPVNDFRVGLHGALHGPAGLFMLVSVLLLVFGVGLAHRFGPLGRGVMAALLAFGLACMTFAVIRTVATGEPGSGGRLELAEDVLHPALRGLALAAAGFALVTGLEQVLEGSGLKPLLVGALRWGLALAAPAWLLRLASGEPLREAVAPQRTLSLIRTLGKDYALTAVLSVVVAHLSTFWLSASALLGNEGMDFFRVVLEVCSAVGLLFLARVLGQLLQARGAELGLSEAPVTWVPAMPDALPRGVRPRP